jgi:mannose-6-phosphate isomerase-like protein (cupin superfamily)
VNDIELLSPYNSAASNKKRLPFPVEFDNEKATAYRLTAADFKNQIIKGRGPMIAELVSGTGIKLHNNTGKQTKKIVAGKYVYIAPGTDFYFSATGKNNVEMVLFEIK